MPFKRLTKSDHPLSFGAFNPVGHVVVAFDNDQRAAEAADSLRAAGFDDEDILQYSAEEESREMSRVLDGLGGVSGFGHEISLMREYKTLAEQGCGWLVVYAPDAELRERLVKVARRHGARIAEMYHRLVIEDLL